MDATDTLQPNPNSNTTASKEIQRSTSGTGDTHPPPTPLVKNKNYAGPPIPLKEKRHSSSIFNVSQDRHLVSLPPIKGLFHMLISVPKSELFTHIGWDAFPHRL